MKKQIWLAAILTIFLAAGIASAAGKSSAEKGKEMFNDPKLGGSANDSSCNSCHAGGKGLENAAEKKKFTKLINFELTVLLDTHNDTFNDWGVKTLPTSFLIDANGQIRYWVRGNPGWEHEDTLSAIDKLITETTKTVTQNQTTRKEAN